VGQCYRQVDERQEPGHGVAPPDRDVGYTALRTANLSPGRGKSRESQCRFNLYSYFADYLVQIQDHAVQTNAAPGQKEQIWHLPSATVAGTHSVISALAVPPTQLVIVATAA
jgi:hypothetical protein